MALTKYFKEHVMLKAKSNASFKKEMLELALNSFLAGDIDDAKALLRDYINAVISFTKLSEDTGIHVKSLQRMLGPTGNPTLNNFCEILQAIQAAEGISIKASLDLEQSS